MDSYCHCQILKPEREGFSISLVFERRSWMGRLQPQDAIESIILRNGFNSFIFSHELSDIWEKSPNYGPAEIRWKILLWRARKRCLEKYVKSGQGPPQPGWPSRLAWEIPLKVQLLLLCFEDVWPSAIRRWLKMRHLNLVCNKTSLMLFSSSFTCAWRSSAAASSTICCTCCVQSVILLTRLVRILPKSAS